MPTPGMLLPEISLSAFASQLNWSDIPATVRHEAKRSILNIIGTALSGCKEQAVDTAIQVMRPFSGASTCSLIGRPERTDPQLASFINGMSANIFDYDDNHPATLFTPQRR